MPPNDLVLRGSTPRPAYFLRWRLEKMPMRRIRPSADVRIVRRAVVPVRHAVTVTVAVLPSRRAIVITPLAHHPGARGVAVAVPRAQPVARNPYMAAMAPFPVTGCPHPAGTRRGHRFVERRGRGGVHIEIDARGGRGKGRAERGGEDRGEKQLAVCHGHLLAP